MHVRPALNAFWKCESRPMVDILSTMFQDLKIPASDGLLMALIENPSAPLPSVFTTATSSYLLYLWKGDVEFRKLVTAWMMDDMMIVGGASNYLSILEGSPEFEHIVRETFKWYWGLKFLYNDRWTQFKLPHTQPLDKLLISFEPVVVIEKNYRWPHDFRVVDSHFRTSTFLSSRWIWTGNVS